MRTRFGLPLVAGLAGFLASTAVGGVDAEVEGNLKARGTISPGGEVESFSFRAVDGTVLTMKVKGDRKTGLVPSLELSLDRGDPVTPGSEFLSVGGTTLSLRNFPLSGSGEWRADVSGEGTGDYSLSLKTRAPKKATGTLSLDAEGGGSFSFAAPGGSTLTLAARAAKGSGAIPRMTLLSADSGGSRNLDGEGSVKPTSHTATVAVPGEGGDLTLDLVNDGAAGDVLLLVKIKAPKAAREKFDLRGVVLGEPGGGETFLARGVGSDGGVLEVASGKLAGAGLTIPEGALDSLIKISIASAPTPVPASGDDQAAGPAVDLQPSGLTFAQAATLTLPFDPALVPVNKSPEDIRVLVVEGNGSTFEITPTSVDEENGTLTLPINGFSICIPVIRSGQAPLGVNPGGDEYWFVTLEYEVTPDESGNDSRARYFLQEVGEVSFFGDGTVQTSSSWRTVSFDNAPSAQNGFDANVQAFEFPQEYEATWQYGPDGRSILLTEGEDGGATLISSRDGSVLVEFGEEDEPVTGWSVGVRKNASPLTTTSLNGTWTVGGVEMGASTDSFGGPATTKLNRFLGTATFLGNGKVTFAYSERTAEVRPLDSSVRESVESGKETATYEVREDGTILVTFPDEEGNSDLLRLMPGRNADVMLMVDDDACGSCTFAAILVRQSSNASTALLSGDYLGSMVSVGLEVYAPLPGGSFPQPDIGDPQFFILDFDVPFDGGNSAALTASEHGVQRDGNSEGGVRSSVEPFSTSLGIAVDKKGSLTLTPTGEGDLLKGAVAPDGMFGFFVTNPARSDHEFLLGMMVKAPPAND